MTIDDILNEIYPPSVNIHRSQIEMEFWLYKRERLRNLIMKYKAGELIKFEPMKLSVDIDELLKKLRN